MINSYHNSLIINSKPSTLPIVNSISKNNYAQIQPSINFQGKNINGTVVKKASIFNVSKLVKLYADYRIGAGFPKQAENKKKLYKFIINQLRLPGTKIFMIKKDGKNAGFIHLTTHHSTIDSMRSAIIQSLYIKPEFRNKGMAKGLIEKAKDWVVKKEYKGLFVKTLSSNEKSKKLYKNIEFKDETDRYASYFWNNYKAFDGNR